MGMIDRITNSQTQVYEFKFHRLSRNKEIIKLRDSIQTDQNPRAFASALWGSIMDRSQCNKNLNFKGDT